VVKGVWVRVELRRKGDGGGGRVARGTTVVQAWLSGDACVEGGGRRAGLAHARGEEAGERMRGSGVSGGLRPPTFIPPFSPFLFSFFLWFKSYTN